MSARESLYIRVEGGLGKQVMFTSFLPMLKNRFSEIWVDTPYPEIFEGNSYVSEINPDTTSNRVYEKVNSPSTTVVLENPYNCSEFIKGKCHLLNAWASLVDMRITNPQKQLPSIYLTSEEEFAQKDLVKETISNVLLENNWDGVIFLQLAGGAPPQDCDNGDAQEYGIWDPMARTYPWEYRKKLVEILKNEFPTKALWLYGREAEQHPREVKDNAIMFTPEISAKIYVDLLQEFADGVVTIDSSLQHLAAAARTPSIVMWGGTSKKQFGYDIHTNLSGKGGSGIVTQTPHMVSNPSWKKIDKRQNLEKLFPKPEEVIDALKAQRGS